MYEDLQYEIRLEIPEYRDIRKDKSGLMKAIGKLLFFNKRFMSGYVTTIYPNIYWSTEVDERPWDGRFITLSHEILHLKSQKKNGLFLSAVAYLFPQILAIFSLLAILSIWLGAWWLLALAFLLSLVPWPAPFRTKEELQAYIMTMFVIYNLYGRILPDTIEQLAEEFYGSPYYYMWPHKQNVRKRLIYEAGKIERGDYNNAKIYRNVKKIIEREKNGLSTD